MANSSIIVAALVATQPVLAGNKESQDALVATLDQQGARVALYRQYEEGEHRAGITEQMRKMLRLGSSSSGIDDFSDNYCQIVVDKMANRLRVTGITTKNDAVDTNWLNPLLQMNDWEALQGHIFRGAIREGDSYVMVDPITLKWITEPAYDGYTGLWGIFTPTGKTAVWACKLWEEGVLVGSEIQTKIRVVVYEPLRVSYFIADPGGQDVEVYTPPSVAVESQTEDTVETNVRVWTVGKTPIVRFSNKPENYSEIGKSELRPAIPLQDVTNRTLHSLVVASEFSAFRMKWSIGMEVNASDILPGAVLNLVVKDKDGNVITELTPELAEFLNAVKVGEFGETDMSQYITQIDMLAREISHVTQTPIYGVTTQGVLSAEALKQLEIGLIGKVERFQTDNNDAIRELIQLTALIQQSFTTASLLPPAPTALPTISIIWKPAELLDVPARIAILIQMRKDSPGLWTDDFYRRKIGELMGLTEDTIEKESTEAQSQSANFMESLIGGGGGIPVV